MREVKLFNIIRYLKSVEFYHDTFDLEDEGVQGVLMDYGIHEGFSGEELQELGKALYELAERNEFREAARYAGDAGTLEGMRMMEAF